jgi:hypothetical protein
MRIDIFAHAGPAADFWVERVGSDGVEIPVVARVEDDQSVLVIFDHDGDEIWHLDLLDFRKALDKATEELNTWPRQA